MLTISGINITQDLHQDQYLWIRAQTALNGHQLDEGNSETDGHFLQCRFPVSARSKPVCARIQGR
jgi:hypothetical protein